MYTYSTGTIALAGIVFLFLMKYKRFCVDLTKTSMKIAYLCLTDVYKLNTKTINHK